MPPLKLTNELITAAIEGFESQKVRIEAQIADLRATLSGSPAESATLGPPTRKKRRKLSAAARQRIGDAQRRRWAQSKQGSGPSSTAMAGPAKRKRKLSAAGRAAIIAATKKRWALKRAEAAKAQSATAKKGAGKKAAAKT